MENWYTDPKLSEWCKARLRDAREEEAIDADTPDAVIEREAKKLEVLLTQMASAFIDNEFDGTDDDAAKEIALSMLTGRDSYSDRAVGTSISDGFQTAEKIAPNIWKVTGDFHEGTPDERTLTDDDMTDTFGPA